MARQETDFNRGTFWYNGKGYCNWGWFEDNILNTHFGFIANKEGTLQTKHRSYIRSFSTNTKVDSAGLHSVVSTDPTTCRFSKHLYTIGKDIILPHKHYPLMSKERLRLLNLKQTVKDEYEALRVFHQLIDEYFEPFKHPTKTGKKGNALGIIRNIVFSADYLINHFSHGVRSLESALNSFWSRVTSVYGGYWNFEIVQSQNTNGRIGVIDNYIAENSVQSVSCFPTIGNKSTPETPKKNFEFSVYGLNSLMSDFSVDVSLDSKLVTQAIYHTNKDIVTKGNSGMNMPEYLSIKALSTLNNAIVTEDEIDNLGNEIKAQDAVLTEVTTPYLQGQHTYAKGSTVGPLRLKTFRKIDEVNKQLEVAIENANQRIKDRDTRDEYEHGAWWPKETEKTKFLVYKPDGEMFKQLKKGMLFHLNDSQDSRKEIDPIVPLSVSFTISGIGGIRIGDCFAIDYLPEVYRQYSVFQVSKVTHTVGADGWKTAIDGLLRIDVNSLEKVAKEKRDEEQEKPLVYDKLSETIFLESIDGYMDSGTYSSGGQKGIVAKAKTYEQGTSLKNLKELEDFMYDTIFEEGFTTSKEWLEKFGGQDSNKKFKTIKNEEGKEYTRSYQSIYHEFKTVMMVTQQMRKNIFKKENFPDEDMKKVRRMRNGRKKNSPANGGGYLYTRYLTVVKGFEEIFQSSQ